MVKSITVPANSANSASRSPAYCLYIAHLLVRIVCAGHVSRVCSQQHHASWHMRGPCFLLLACRRHAGQPHYPIQNEDPVFCAVQWQPCPGSPCPSSAHSSCCTFFSCCWRPAYSGKEPELTFMLHLYHQSEVLQCYALFKATICMSCVQLDMSLSALPQLARPPREKETSGK